MAILSECREDTDDMLWDIYKEKDQGRVKHVRLKGYNIVHVDERLLQTLALLSHFWSVYRIMPFYTELYFNFPLIVIWVSRVRVDQQQIINKYIKKAFFNTFIIVILEHIFLFRASLCYTF